MFPDLIVFIVLIPMCFIMIASYKFISTFLYSNLVVPEETLWLS